MTNNRLLFKLQNLTGLSNWITDEEDDIIEEIWWNCSNLLLSKEYMINSKLKAKIQGLLKINENNNTILAANLLLKLKLEEQKLR